MILNSLCTNYISSCWPLEHSLFILYHFQRIAHRSSSLSLSISLLQLSGSIQTPDSSYCLYDDKIILSTVASTFSYQLLLQWHQHLFLLLLSKHWYRYFPGLNFPVSQLEILSLRLSSSFQYCSVKNALTQPSITPESVIYQNNWLKSQPSPLCMENKVWASERGIWSPVWSNPCLSENLSSFPTSYFVL